MTAVAATRTWLRRMAEVVPAAWHYDRVFRWAAIGAGIALAMLVLRLAASPALRQPPPLPASAGSARPAPNAAATGSWPVPPVPTAVPKIAPGRALAGVTITPAPPDRFGTAAAATGKGRP
jgi:hypothetical protein